MWGKKKWSKEDMKKKKDWWNGLSEEEKEAEKAKWQAEWDEKKKNATPEELAKMEKWEKKKEEWNNMSEDEQKAAKEEWKKKYKGGKWGKGKKGYDKKDYAKKKEQWMKEWKQMKTTATPEQLEKMGEWEKKMEEWKTKDWKNMSDEDKKAMKTEWKDTMKEKKEFMAELKKTYKQAHGKKAMNGHRQKTEKKRKFKAMSEEDKAAHVEKMSKMYNEKKMEWAKKIAEKKGLSEEQTEAFMKHIQNLSFGKLKGGKNKKGGRGRKLSEVFGRQSRNQGGRRNNGGRGQHEQPPHPLHRFGGKHPEGPRHEGHDERPEQKDQE